MRILVHDYAGHPFPFDLSRALARYGHEVRHTFCASLHTGPTGSFERRPDDPPNFVLDPVELGEPLDKFSFIKRWFQENEYGRLASARVESFLPDVIISGNTPLDAQRRLWDTAGRIGAKRIFWTQDLIGLATRRILGKKLPLVGHLIGSYYIRLEKILLAQSDQVIVISDDFVPTLESWGIGQKKIDVIENWAPIGQIPVQPRLNSWSTEMGYDDKFVFMYTGTMGMKHNPELILELARHFQNHPDVRIVVASAGLGARWLADRAKDLDLDNLDIMGFHDFDQLPVALASADVLVAVLEKDADVYSVPSKVLAYLCSGRPILLAVPSANLASRIVRDNRAGLTAEPADKESFVGSADLMYKDKSQRTSCAANARSYAEQHFDIETIAPRFETVFEQALHGRPASEKVITPGNVSKATG